jgi:RNA polymerase sigma factor (sigma-70 family)
MGAHVVAARRRDLLPVALLRLASDQRLVEAVHGGSERAFEVLFDRYRRPMLAFCRRMLGSQEEAEDAVQQTFLSAYRELMRAAQPHELRPWLYTIARNRCISTLRARRERSLADVAELSTDHLAAELTTREDLRAVLADVARLPDDQRAALVLAELGDNSHEEIARHLGCPREKVKALVFQARSSLTDARAAREISCAEVQQQLATLRGAALRRTVLRRHLHDCGCCRAFRDQVRTQRRRLGLLLPVGPALALKRAVLGALFGSGGAAGGVGALGGAGLAVTALVAVAIPGGPVAAALSPSHDAREPARRVALARPATDTATASTPPRRATALERVRKRGSAAAGPVTKLSERPAKPRPNGDDARPAPSGQPDGNEPAERTSGADQAEPPAPQSLADPPEADPQLPPPMPAEPRKPPHANRPATPPKPTRPVTPAPPQKSNGNPEPAKPPVVPGEAKPANPAAQHPAPPAAVAEPAPGPSGHPPPVGAGPADAPGKGAGPPGENQRGR